MNNNKKKFKHLTLDDRIEIMECHNQASREKIQQVVDWFIEDNNHNIVYTFHNEKQNKDVTPRWQPPAPAAPAYTPPPVSYDYYEPASEEIYYDSFFQKALIFELSLKKL